MRMDNGKLIEFFDNRNYAGESKFLWKTYYGYYNNPVAAILSIISKR